PEYRTPEYRIPERLWISKVAIARLSVLYYRVRLLITVWEAFFNETMLRLRQKATVRPECSPRSLRRVGPSGSPHKAPLDAQPADRPRRRRRRYQEDSGLREVPEGGKSSAGGVIR